MMKYRILPAILGVDIGAVFEQALCNIDPAMERGDMEGSAHIIVPSLNKGAIFLEELADGGGVVLMSVPEYERSPADPSLLFLLIRGGGSLGRGPRIPSSAR